MANTKTTTDISKDEVDFVASRNSNNNNNNGNNLVEQIENENMPKLDKNKNEKAAPKKADKPQPAEAAESTKKTSLFASFGKKLYQRSNSSSTANVKAAPAQKKKQPCAMLALPTPAVPIGTPPRQHKFTKSPSSISRLLGRDTYNAKKFEKQEQKRRLAANDSKFHTFHGARRRSPYLERFRQLPNEDGAAMADTTDSRQTAPTAATEQFELAKRHDDIGSKAMRTLSRGLGKLLRKRSVEISNPDPEYKVSYLGNVLTSWGKGEGCMEKQLNTLWRNYTQSSKPDVIMRLKVCASGLKATTRQHGLTEYWANRITDCCTPKNYPRIFCWTYRHEGRKLKHELRCHAVLCSKEKVAHDVANILRMNLESALREFKHEKLLKQNARLSLANAIYDNPSLPQRKILLSVGGLNYRPPLERSKSAPKLFAIEEAIGEEDGDEIEETNEPEMRSCCQQDSLYPAMTLGRRRCRRGHSIRRTGKICANAKPELVASEVKVGKPADTPLKSYGSDGSLSDDFDKLLKCNDYDKDSSLSTELLPYFDLQLHKNNSQSLGSLSELPLADVDVDVEADISIVPTINSDPNAHPMADYKPTEIGEEREIEPCDVQLRNGASTRSDGEEEEDDVDDVYFRQAAILTMLHRSSMRKMAQLAQPVEEQTANRQFHHQAQSSISSNASSMSTATATLDGSSPSTQHKRLGGDSDEGSISSGCETSSTATANHDERDAKHKYQTQPARQESVPDFSALLDSSNVEDLASAELQEIYQRFDAHLHSRHNSDATINSSSSTTTLKLSTSPTPSLTMTSAVTPTSVHDGSTRAKHARKSSNARDQQRRVVGRTDSDSECSDESGYVELEDRKRHNAAAAPVMLPPKPLPRRSLSGQQTGTAV